MIIKNRPKKKKNNEVIFNCSLEIKGMGAVRAIYKEIGTPRTHRKFLGRFEGSYGPIPNKKLLGLIPMPFNTTNIENLYCVGDSCFPGQGLNAVAFSGYACAHKIGSKLNINDFKLPDWIKRISWQKNLKHFFL